jgi:pimeloyl-ACP methyl ester carboxylesterase
VTEAVTASSGVRHLVYLCAFQLDVGESLLGAVGGQAPPWWEVHDTYVVATAPEQVVDNGVPAELAAASVPSMQLQSRASLEQELTRAAWHDVPSTYIVSDNDEAIPPVAQEGMSQRSGTVHHLPSGHSPFLSHPQELAGLLRPLL